MKRDCRFLAPLPPTLELWHARVHTYTHTRRPGSRFYSHDTSAAIERNMPTLTPTCHQIVDRVLASFHSPCACVRACVTFMAGGIRPGVSLSPSLYPSLPLPHTLPPSLPLSPSSSLLSSTDPGARKAKGVEGLHHLRVDLPA